MAKLKRGPRVVNVKSVTLIWDNKAVGFLGSVPIPKPKGLPLTLQIKVPKGFTLRRTDR